MLQNKHVMQLPYRYSLPIILPRNADNLDPLKTFPISEVDCRQSIAA